MAAIETKDVGLSPRERESLRSIRHRCPADGSIPAWAGEPRRRSPCRRAPRVYPRVGGGAAAKLCRFGPCKGLSPRGRGSRIGRTGKPCARGSIPAWAGEPRRSQIDRTEGWVYPRVGWGAPLDRVDQRRGLGLSPRGRGSPSHQPLKSRASGSIPAWAGEPCSAITAPRAPGVYPRVGGGASPGRISPAPGKGLSPRGRGSPHAYPPSRDRQGSIPAWAGEPPSACLRRGWRRVYPRVGGGAGIVTGSEVTTLGLSPRGRGSRSFRLLQLAENGSIPAWAGEPAGCIRSVPNSRVYPRVGGGAPAAQLSQAKNGGLSPRGRGSQRLMAKCHECGGSIPAGAGEPPRLRWLG